jgi:hypothetical protein
LSTISKTITNFQTLNDICYKGGTVVDGLIATSKKVDAA